MATSKANSAATETVPEAIDFGPEGWRPNPGDSITGKVLDLTTGQGDYAKYPIVTLQTKDGEVNVHAFHHTLKNRLREMRPKRGHTLTITFLGEVPQTRKSDGEPIMVDGKPKTLMMYSADSPEFEFNWDTFE